MADRVHGLFLDNLALNLIFPETSQVRLLFAPLKFKFIDCPE